MFKSIPVGLAALTFLSEDVKATKLTYRPTVEQAPWYKTAGKSTWNTPDWKIGYKVPNFGVDSEILTTHKNLADAEGALGTKFTASFETPKSHPVDYPVPNFGKDRDLIINDINLDQAELQHSHKLVASFDAPKGHPVDYFVPNFGVDKEILASQKHEVYAEGKAGKKLAGDYFADASPKYPVDYTVPNFGMDHDIKTAQKNIVDTEAKLGKWTPVQDADGAYVVPQLNTLPQQMMAVQLDSQDDPICNSSGCTQYLHPKETSHAIDYPVPSFGADPDMQTTANSIAIGEKQLNHKIIMGTDESKAQWANPALKAPYDFKPKLDHDVIVTNTNQANAESSLGKSMEMVQIKDDPICSSAGCTQYEHPKKKGYPMDYFVPNFGQDKEIGTTDTSLAIAEKQLKHKFTISDAPAADKKDYVVPNFGVDQDIVDSKNSLEQSQESIGHTWTPTQDVNGYWNVPAPFANDSYNYHNRDVFLQLDSQDDPICSSAGCTQYEHPKKKGHPMDYFVPNFGQDKDIGTSESSLAIAEKQLNHKFTISDAPKADTKDYFVPNFGADQDIADTKNSLQQSEESTGHTWTPTLAQKEHKMDYFVPNFGKDKDMDSVDSSLAIAEKQLKHKFTISDAGKPDKTDYFVPNFGADQDIADSKNSLEQSEETTGHTWTPTQDVNGYWNVPAPFAQDSYTYHNRDVFVQLDQQDDPICSSAGCTQYEHPKKKGYPMDYPVPDFGADHDIAGTDNSLEVSEKQLKHKFVINDLGKSTPAPQYNDQNNYDIDTLNSFKSMEGQEGIHGSWDPKQDKDGNWIVPEPINNKAYSYVADVQLQSQDDPICNSSGCTQYLHPKETSHAIDYPVPSFGADPDMLTTANSIAIGEKQLNHKIIMGTDESKAQWANPALKAPYNFNPALDHDVVVTKNNQANAEAALGKEM